MYPVFFDTCVLLKSYLCDTILTVAETGAYNPLWSVGVIKELESNLLKFGLNQAQVEHRLHQMKQCFPGAMVSGYEALIPEMTNDPKDRHVLAAAVHSGAEILVTENLRDFPSSAIDKDNYDLVVMNQDDFLIDLLSLWPDLVLESLHLQTSRYRREPRSVTALLDLLSKPGHGCAQFAEACRRKL